MIPNAPKTVRMANGRDVDINNVLDEDMDMEAIAHALSLICRWGGHCTFHYSVGQHSLYAAEVAIRTTGDQSFARKVLLHDATEAFLCDVPSPLKRFSFMDAYCTIERSLRRRIWKHYEVDHEDDPALDAIDAAMIAIEARQLMPMRGSFLEHFPLPSYMFEIQRIPRQRTVVDSFMAFWDCPSIGGIIRGWQERT